MPVYQFRAQLCWRQSSSESQTAAPRGWEFRRRELVIESVADPVLLGGAGRELAAPGEHLGQVEITQLDPASPRHLASLRTDRSSGAFWRGSGPGGVAPAYFYHAVNGIPIVPGLQPSTIDNGAYLPNGDPVARVLVADAAATALGAGPWAIQIGVEPQGLLEGERVQSSVQFDSWLDTSVDPPSPEGVWPILDRELSAMRSRGDGRLDVGMTGAPLAVAGACGAFTNGDVFILPSDVGFANNQIPNDPAMLTPQRLRAQPSVFVRRSDAIVEIDAIGRPDPNAVPISVAPPRVMMIVAAPQYSWWDVLIDGAWRRVLVRHNVDGAFIDVRRPRDIYNAIINTAIVRRTLAVWDYLDVQTGPGTFARSYFQRGELTTVAYSQAWRFRGVSVPYTVDGEPPPPITVPMPFDTRPPDPPGPG